MFKGLRTKIESERIQSNVQSHNQSQTNNLQFKQSTASYDSAEKQDGNQETNTNSFQQLDSEIEHKAPSIKDTTGLKSSNITKFSSDHLSIDLSTESQAAFSSRTDLESNEIVDGSLQTSKSATNEHLREESCSVLNDELSLVVAAMTQEIQDLKAELERVKSERDESNNQNSLLYTIIEKLRRNLDTEIENKSSLKSKVTELEEELKTAIDEASSTRNLLEDLRMQKETKSDTPKDDQKQQGDVDGQSNDKELADPNGVCLQEINSDKIKVFREKVEDLTKQLWEKNKIIRVKQQNENDLKKALQKEILEHSKTKQLALGAGNNRLQNNESLQASTNSIHNANQISHYNNHSNNINLTNIDSPSNNSVHTDLTSGSTTLNHYLARHQTTLSLASHDGSESPNAGTMTPQLDRMSCRSRSSASVSEFDTNDMTNKEVNHEYLRNVLYRYMISTDTEKAQHLIKAISVLMNFSPEQCSAIKSAMNSRSSWLRLR